MLGDFEKNPDGGYTVKMPVMLVTRQDKILLAPLLSVVEEDEITIEESDLLFGHRLFTPKVEILNDYSRIYGTGIEIPNSLIL